MGIDKVGLEAIIVSHKYLPQEKRNAMLALARQQIHINPQMMYSVFKKYNINLNLHNYGEYFENLFVDFGYKTTDSIDNSAYENATIIHNLNLPHNLPLLENMYNYIFDGGTIEHIFNCPQVCENIISMLEVGGIYCSVTVNNNFSGHGMYQFSPEFFLSAFAPKYGMEVLELYITEVGADRECWIDVKSFNGWRNNTQIKTLQPVYIIAIIRKISNTRESLLLNPPNQYSYENIDWNK